MQKVASLQRVPCLHLEAYQNFRVTLGGVILNANWDDEDHYIETQPFHSKEALKAALYTAEAVGLEVMPPSECYAIDYDDGRCRVYLAENPLDSKLALAWPSFLEP